MFWRIRGTRRERSSSHTAPATWADVNRDVIRTIGMPGEKYFAWMCLVALTLACGAAASACSIARTGVAPIPALSSTTGRSPDRRMKLPRGA